MITWTVHLLLKICGPTSRADRDSNASWERHERCMALLHALPKQIPVSRCRVSNAESRNASNHMKDAECHAALFATWQGLVQESNGFPMFSQCSHHVLCCLVLSCILLIWETLHYNLALLR